MALIDKRSRLGETQSLQQFSRDADEANAWINEKLQTTLDESYKDPANIQVIVLRIDYIWIDFSRLGSSKFGKPRLN